MSLLEDFERVAAEEARQSTPSHADRSQSSSRARSPAPKEESSGLMSAMAIAGAAVALAYTVQDNVYLVLLSGVLSCSLAVQWQRAGAECADPSFRSFQICFLVPYLVMTAGDWMQGPYLHDLYEKHHSLEASQVQSLKAIGFASGMIFGPMIGALTDRWGRKKCAMLCSLLYAASCCCGHFNDFSVLALGRALGGASTALLFTVFDAWMLTEHSVKGFSPEWIGSTYSLFFFANGIVAVLSGLTADAAFSYTSAYTAPFDVAVLFLLLSGVLIALLWDENYGDASSARTTSLWAILTDPVLLCVGLGGAAYEAVMYVFVFQWVPSLYASAPPDAVLPLGTIFACFMACTMLGSALFSRLSKTSVFVIGPAIAAVSAVALGSVAVLDDSWSMLGCFCLFETCLGLYFPTIGVMRSKVIDDSVNATVSSIFRVPLNMTVLGALLQISERRSAFLFCGGLLGVSAVLFIIAGRLQERREAKIKSS